MAKELCYARPRRRSWPLKQGSMGDISELKEDLEQKITTWQREVDLKLMKSVWGAHVRTPEEDELSEECVCDPPRVCLWCHRPPETVERDLLYAYQALKDTTKDADPVEDHLPASIHQKASDLHSDEDMEDKIKLLDPRVQKLLSTYLEVFRELPPPASCGKLVQMDLKLRPEFLGHKTRRRPYPAPKEQVDEIERQIQECIDAGLVLEYKDGDYPQYCSPCFLVAKPGSTAKRLVVDYGELNKKTLNHSGSIPNMESTPEKMASCRYKTKMDKLSGFWQVDLTPNAQELLAFITPQGRVFRWKVMPFGVANAPTLFQKLMNKILSFLRRRHQVQELISRGAQREAHIEDVGLGTNTQEDPIILLGEFFAVCQENHTRLKLEKCEFMQETMQYLGFDIGYGWWTPAASKAKPLMDAKVRHEDPKKGLHDVRSFIGAWNFYCRHIKNFTYTSAILTDLIKKTTTWRWGPQEQQVFDELKDKVSNAKCLAVPEDDTRHTAANHTVDTDTSPTPTTRRTHRCGAPTHNGAPMDAVHPKNPLQPADQRPPLDAPRGHRGIPTHSEAPTPATRRQPTTGPRHTRANSPPPTVETIHPSHTPPLTTHGHRTGATTRPRSRDPPTRGPHERNTPHHWAHSTVG